MNDEIGGLEVLERTETAAEDNYLRVSYSSMNVFESCARKFEFQKLYPRSSDSREQFAADVGTAIHHGYQNYLIHNDRDQATWAYLKDYPYALEFMQEKDDRSCEAGLATLESMYDSIDMAEWELASIKRPDGIIVPAIEVPFELRFKGITLPDGRGIAFTGFLDALMSHRFYGTKRTLDIKTHRRYAKDAVAKYKFDSQQVPYGIIVEHLQSNPVESFEVLYLDCFVDVGEPRVTLYPFTKTKEDIQEWLMKKVMQFQTMIRYMEMDFFPRTDGGCTSWNKPCWFLDVCQSRNQEAITEWLLNGGEPTVRPYEQPWIIADLELFGE
jgi:hypothetical protein